MRIYLDNNATTWLHPEVLDVMIRTQRDAYGNPGSRHAEGREARKVLEESRESIAAILDAHPEELIFTSGGTESINLALLGLTTRALTSSTGANVSPGRILITEGEHPATRETARELATRGWRLENLPVDARGLLDSRHLAERDWSDVRLASVILAHNETGVIQEIGPFSEKCLAANVPLHLDAVQAVGKIPVSFRATGAAALSFAAHKFHGPRGVGGLLVRRGLRLTPRTFGGGQEGERRPGTEPVMLIAGMAKALELWHRDQSARAAHLGHLRDELERLLAARCAPVIIHGRDAPRIPNTLCIGFPQVSGEALLVSLDLEGVASSLGSACASGSAEPAPVLLSMGVSRELALSSLRLTLGMNNTHAEIVAAAGKIESIVARMRAAWGFDI